VVVCGDVIHDSLVKPIDPVVRGSDTVSVIEARPGGSAATQAAWLGWLGVDVTFAGRCGARDVAYHRAELERFGVRTYLVPDPSAGTGSIVIMVAPDGERTMFTDRGANLRLRVSDLPPDLLDDAAVLHLTGYTFFEPGLREVALSLLADARGRGLAFTVDPGSAAFLARLAPGEFAGWTSDAAICFPNLDEAAVLTGSSDVAEMAERLSSWYRLVVLKLGSAGCVIAERGSAPVRVAGVPARVQDTTGAGDAFCAAFLGRWLAGDEPAAAAGHAVRIAATAVSVLGGRPSLASSASERRVPWLGIRRSLIYAWLWLVFTGRWRGRRRRWWRRRPHCSPRCSRHRRPCRSCCPPRRAGQWPCCQPCWWRCWRCCWRRWWRC
jgi:sugar/nucleoside kinase (ribokinase family)